MKLVKLVTPAAIAILFLVISCTGPAGTPGVPTPTPTLPSEGKTIVVNSTADSGSGSLRQAFLDAQSGDTITFDPAVFPPSAPATIYLSSSLPPISQGNLTIDASNAGVTLDSSNISEKWAPGLDVTSDGNLVQGLQIVNFSTGPGISLSGGAQNNIIGGNRGIGSGPVGQGNLVSNGEMGIRLCGDGTSFNTITGNLIGTDATGTEALGNNLGIYIENGASHNIIGPDNIIAYNRQQGVGIVHSNSIGNTITKNSIHNNERGGIYLMEGGNAELSVPFIFDFGLEAGTITGTTCPNCTVEIFSDSGNEGKIYECQTTADSTGFFTFNKGASFTGSHLTATATDADGNTSEFSVPTTGTGRAMILQEGDNLAKTKFQAKESKELQYNGIGDMTTLKMTQRQLEVFLEYVNREGFKWMHASLDYYDWDEVANTGEYSQYYVDPNHDRAITDLAANGIKIMYCLVFWDELTAEKFFGKTQGKMREKEEFEHYSRFKTEEEIQRYLDYVQFIVHHFKDRIEYYEILNEPETPYPGGYVEPTYYINLVKRTVPVIRKEYPEAKIVIGATSDVSHYLFQILSPEILPLVDAISWHPMYGTSPECEHVPGYYYNYPSIVQEIKDVASAHGFDGEYIAEELNWRTPRNASPVEPCLYSETVAAKYYARGIAMHLGMGVTTGLTWLEMEPEALKLPKMRVVQNLCTVMAGTEPVSLPMEIQSEATNIRSYGFSLPNGDRLLALWTDGVAVDDDPGVRATLIFPGFSAQEATAIDVLNGFQQQMITITEDGNLVIRNLLVKDYPIILRLSDWQ